MRRRSPPRFRGFPDTAFPPELKPEPEPEPTSATSIPVEHRDFAIAFIRQCWGYRATRWSSR